MISSSDLNQKVGKNQCISVAFVQLINARKLLASDSENDEDLKLLRNRMTKGLSNGRDWSLKAKENGMKKADMINNNRQPS